MSKFYDVIIAGAGPVGLFVACELGLSGASVLVLERFPDPKSEWKDFPLGLRGMNSTSVETFQRRGMMDKLFSSEEQTMVFTTQETGFQFGGHFAGISMNANKLELDRWKYRVNSPALRPRPGTLGKVEEVLTECAEKLGVQILRGTGFTKIVKEDDKSITVEAGEDNQQFRGRWLVGCDGGRSSVRKAAGFEFTGTEALTTGYVLKCELDHPERLQKGFNPTDNGMYIIGIPGTMHLLDFDGGAFSHADVSLDHVQQVLNRLTGKSDVKFTKLEAASTFTDRSKQATQYRKGRVLLAGDAAHIHPPLGGQGLNLGIGDAMNLGWKLAATVRQETKAEENHVPLDLALLDTYESERHPIGAGVLAWTRAQISILEPSPHGRAMQNVVRDMINTTDGANMFMDRFWGLGQRYDPGNSKAHPAVGRSAPDFEFEDGSRLGSKLDKGVGLLVDFRGDTILQDLVATKSRVGYLATKAKDSRDIGAILVRPDGIVAWAADEGSKIDPEEVKAALEKWVAV